MSPRGRAVSLRDLSESDKIYSPSRRKVAAFWIASHREDRYDDDTTYWITVWDASTGQVLETIVHVHKFSHMTGAERGSGVHAIEFVDDARLRVHYTDEAPTLHELRDEPRPIPDPRDFDAPWDRDG